MCVKEIVISPKVNGTYCCNEYTGIYCRQIRASIDFADNPMNKGIVAWHAAQMKQKLTDSLSNICFDCSVNRLLLMEKPVTHSQPRFVVLSQRRRFTDQPKQRWDVRALGDVIHMRITKITRSPCREGQLHTSRYCCFTSWYLGTMSLFKGLFTKSMEARIWLLYMPVSSLQQHVLCRLEFL